uniref:Uncharacterized protein n=1 Tax=Timema genevievae TaxID=629358 RepID=A0A7R9K1B6_TIMGE|nr:unnamed protein product [Timema genevievae]
MGRCRQPPLVYPGQRSVPQERRIVNIKASQSEHACALDGFCVDRVLNTVLAVGYDVTAGKGKLVSSTPPILNHSPQRSGLVNNESFPPFTYLSFSKTCHTTHLRATQHTKLVMFVARTGDTFLRREARNTSGW